MKEDETETDRESKNIPLCIGEGAGEGETK